MDGNKRSWDIDSDEDEQGQVTPRRSTRQLKVVGNLKRRREDDDNEPLFEPILKRRKKVAAIDKGEGQYLVSMWIYSKMTDT